MVYSQLVTLHNGWFYSSIFLWLVILLLDHVCMILQRLAYWGWKSVPGVQGRLHSVVCGGQHLAFEVLAAVSVSSLWKMPVSLGSHWVLHPMVVPTDNVCWRVGQGWLLPILLLQVLPEHCLSSNRYSLVFVFWRSEQQLWITINLVASADRLRVVRPCCSKIGGLSLGGGVTGILFGWGEFFVWFWLGF